MKVIQKSQLDILLRNHNGPCISIYLNANRGLNTPEGIAQFRGELRKVAILMGTEYSRAITGQLLGKLKRGFLDATRQRPQTHLALFASADFSGYLHHFLQPVVRTVVADSFHVRPLIRWMDKTLIGTAWVAHQDQLHTWKLYPEEPELESIVAFDGITALREHLAQLRPNLSSPAVFVGSSPLAVDLAKTTLHHPALPLLAFSCSGCLTVQEWLPQAQKFAQEWEDRRRQRVLESYQLGNDTRRCSSSLPHIARLLRRGQIETLVVNRDVQLWGVHSDDFGTINIRPRQRDCRDDDLLDDLVEEALRQRIPMVEADSHTMPHARWRPVVALVTGDGLSSSARVRQAQDRPAPLRPTDPSASGH